MKQITPEIKVRVFALYWGQSIVNMGVNDRSTDYLKVKANVISGGWHSLVVTPLKNISNEDAIEVAKILSTEIRYTRTAVFLYEVTRHDNDIFVRITADYRKTVKKPNPETEPICTVRIRDLHVMGSEGVGAVSILSSIDYLRSKGYALPYLDWSVDELVESGVFKLKEVSND